MTAVNDDQPREVDSELAERPCDVDSEPVDLAQVRMRQLYEDQLRRRQCRNGGCGEGVFLD